jgi:hypothetical protein
MPAHKGLRPDDCHGLEHRRKPTIQQDKEQAIAVRELLIASTLGIAGIAMTPLPAWIVAGALAAAAVFAVILDLVKVPAFRRLKIT